MRYLALFLFAVFAFFQYELWVGDGGWRDMWTMEQKLTRQQEENRAREARNAAMRVEVENLKQGGEALTETARAEFGYVQKGEIFYRITQP